jgi:hypothetical protein
MLKQSGLWLSSFVLCALILTGCSFATAGSPATQGAGVSKYAVDEIVLRSDALFQNPFWDAAAQADFVSPSGKKVHVEGFYFGEKEWRIRFVPREVGHWTYRAALEGKANDKSIAIRQSGSFDCIAARPGAHGFLQPSRINPYRLQYEDGKPFYGVGVQTTGPFTPDLDGPDAAEAGAKWRSVPAEQWAKEFQGAANLCRIQFGQGITVGMATPLIPVKILGKGDKAHDNPKYAQILPDGVPDRYDLENAAKLDDVYRIHRGAGFSEILTLMQDMSAFGEQETAFGNSHDVVNYKSAGAKSFPYQEKYIRYVVARYGAFVDIWEIFNEDAFASEEYLAALHKIIRRADPYGHIITSNFSLYDSATCEIIVPHEYVSISANEIDAYLSKQIAAYKSFGKPIQYTEFGNKASLSNYDPDKWRIALWTAYMNECGMLYWSMSGTKTMPKANSTSNANTYLGPDTREHFRIFHRLTADLPVDMRPRYTHPGWIGIRSYALGNGKQTIVYVHHFEDHRKEFVMPGNVGEGISVETGAGTFRYAWTDPGTGKQMGENKAVTTTGRFAIVVVPPVKIDAVCRIERQD